MSYKKLSFQDFKHNVFYIKGISFTGEVFRPSDWVDRLCGVMAVFSPNPQKLMYSPYVQPSICHGIRSVRVDPAIAKIEPKALKFLIQFAKENALEIVLERELNAPISDK